MPVDPIEIKNRGRKAAPAFKKTFQRLERSRTDADERIHELHEEVFACTDCLQCANCCRTTGPLFTRRDVERISAHLGMKPGAFMAKYLRTDEDGDDVLQELPCPFLDKDTNFCSIYDVRPKACREYPHTDMTGQMKIKALTLKNASVCPAVYEILDRLGKVLK